MDITLPNMYDSIFAVIQYFYHRIQSVRYYTYCKQSMNDKRTLEKCKKIMQMFQKQKPKPQCSFKEKQMHNSALASHKKPKQSYPTNRVSFCMPAQRNNRSSSKNSLKPSFNKSTCSINSAQKSFQSHSASKSVNKSKFSSIYNTESRYDKIMKIKIKPEQRRKQDHRSSYINLNASKVSFRSDASSVNQSNSKQSRFDKIMKLKVQKPRVDSTLRHYQPQKQQRKIFSRSKQNIDSNSVLELKKCKQKIKKQTRQADKQDRLWKVFERERELRLKQKQKKERSSYERQRSLEKRFDSLVQKELKRIQMQKQMQQRRQQGFSTYLFPSY